MHNHNFFKDSNIFKPMAFNKPSTFDDPESAIKQSETPYLYLKSTTRNINAMNLSIFNFSSVDINQVLPEIQYQDDETPLVTENNQFKKVGEESRLIEGESTKLC